MKKLLEDIDALLRGHFTRREDLLGGKIDVPVGTLVKAGLLLGMVYGLFMGLFAVLRPENPTWMQLAATTVKVPLLFLLTLVVTFPSLYVFSALANSRLRHIDTLRLLLAAIGVNLALLASFGPVTGFFTLSTNSYPFMVFLNVVFFAISGFIGLGFLRGAVRAVFSPPPPEPVEPAVAEAAGEHGPGTSDESGEGGDGGADGSAGESAGESDAAPESTPAFSRYVPPPPDLSRVGAGRRVFAVWTVIYAIVGAQMGWILRPFVGAPGDPFELFRERESNFFRAVLDTLWHLLF